MPYNSYYTRQEQEDALVTQITNPNRVGSGFINLGPQKRFAPSSTTNWQTAALVGGSAQPPQPLIDIQNAPRPPSTVLPPPPVAQNTKIVPSVPSDKDAVPPAAPPTSKTKVKPGMPPMTDQQRAEGADAPAAVPVKAVAAVAAVAAQLAEDEALARQLQQQMLQHAPAPEPVAAPAEQRADAANRKAQAPQPAPKTPAPSEATTGDATAKRVRALRKKVRDIEQLEERQSGGAVLQQDQLDKIAGKAAIVKELGTLACDTIEKEQGATTGDATAKRVRALRKKVRDIELLQERQSAGAVLEPNQLTKIAGKAAIVKELGALLV